MLGLRQLYNRAYHVACFTVVHFKDVFGRFSLSSCIPLSLSKHEHAHYSALRQRVYNLRTKNLVESKYEGLVYTQCLYFSNFINLETNIVKSVKPYNLDTAIPL